MLTFLIETKYWADVMEISFALMSGGQGKRFGSDKTKACLLGKPLFLYGLELGISVSSDVMHLSRDIFKYEPFIEGVRYLSDEYPFMCPMAGMITAGNNARFDYVFILSADSPLFDRKLIKYFMELAEGHDAVIPDINGKYYNLAAIYSKKMLIGLKSFYKRGMYKIKTCLDDFDVIFPNSSELNLLGFSEDSFLNINTYEDMKKAENIAESL